MATPTAYTLGVVYVNPAGAAISLSKILPVVDLLPRFNIKVSVDSKTASSVVVTVIAKELTPAGTVIVPSPLFTTLFEKV